MFAVFAVFLLCFVCYDAQHNASFAAARTFHKQTFLHKHCFYTSPAFKQALLLHKPCFYTRPAFTQTLFLHKRCLCTSPGFTQKGFTQDLLLHKCYLYTSTVFTQALLLHKACFYTKTFFTRPPFTQTLSLHKLCLYTSIAFIHALLLHNDILLTKAFCNLQTGNRLEGRRNAEGCKYNDSQNSLAPSVRKLCPNLTSSSKKLLPNTDVQNPCPQQPHGRCSTSDQLSWKTSNFSAFWFCVQTIFKVSSWRVVAAPRNCQPMPSMFETLDLGYASFRFQLKLREDIALKARNLSMERLKSTKIHQKIHPHLRNCQGSPRLFQNGECRCQSKSTIQWIAPRAK